MNSTLAIITVTYSPGEHLAAFLDSIAAATSRPYVVILADNGSTDGVPEQAANEHDNVIFLPTGGNVGYGTAINIAAKYVQEELDCCQEYLLVSNPDVAFTPGSIDAMLDCAEANPQAGAVGPLILDLEGEIYPSARAVPTLSLGIGHALLGTIWPANPWTRAYKSNQQMDIQREAGWLSGSCLLLRWKAFNEIGGFDERYFMYMEDVDLGDRLGRAGWRNIFTPAAKIIHDQGHAAGKRPEAMLPAHHESAYRFQADRHPGVLFAPLRLALWLGLKIRARVAVAGASASIRNSVRRGRK